MSDTHSSAAARVLLLNDDDTTMEFVVRVLERVFGKTHEEALKLVLDIHRDGSGECGVYTIETGVKHRRAGSRAGQTQRLPSALHHRTQLDGLISGLVH
jgi:ATP-dependent Clp protease adapter protein ClpS